MMYTPSMFKRLLMIWLIFCTFGYGSVWAFDIHVDDTTEHQELLIGDVDHVNADGSSDGGDDLSCDHCCHAAAHIIALRPARSALVYPGSTAGTTPYQYTFSFNTISPPERPPKTKS